MPPRAKSIRLRTVTTREGKYFLLRLLLTRRKEEEFITSGNSRGKHNSLSRGAGADQEVGGEAPLAS